MPVARDYRQVTQGVRRRSIGPRTHWPGVNLSTLPLAASTPGAQSTFYAVGAALAATTALVTAAGIWVRRRQRR